MAYLIIPLLCFALLAGVSWLFINCLNRKFWDGSVKELRRLLSDMARMKATEPARHLVLVHSRGDVRVSLRAKMTLSSSLVRLEMHLLPTLQRNLRLRYLNILRDLQTDPRIVRNRDDHDVVEWQVEGTPTKAARIIKDTLVRMFGEESTKLIEYHVVEDSSDRRDLDKGWETVRSGELSDATTTATLRQQKQTIRDGQSGCFRILAGIFLWPIPFVIAYLQYGYIAASSVLIAIFILREIMRRWRTRTTEFSIVDVLKIVVLLLAGATINFSDPFYLQIIPTVALTTVAVAQSLASTFNLPWLSLGGYR